MHGHQSDITWDKYNPWNKDEFAVMDDDIPGSLLCLLKLKCLKLLL